MSFEPEDKVAVFEPSASTRTREVATPQYDDSWSAVAAANARHYGPVWSFIEKQNLSIENKLDQADPEDVKKLEQLQKLREEADNHIIENAPYYKNIIGGIAGFVSDPINLTLAAVSGGLSAEATVGAGVGRTMLTVGAAETAATATSEVMLHNIQQTRTVEESMFNSGASFLFAGAMGGIGRSFFPRAAQKAHSDLLKEGLSGHSAEDIYHSIKQPAEPVIHANDEIAMARDSGSESVSASIATTPPSADLMQAHGPSLAQLRERFHVEEAMHATDTIDSHLSSSAAVQSEPNYIIPEGMSPSEALRRMEGDKLFRVEKLTDKTAYTPNMRVGTSSTLEGRLLGQELMGDALARERNMTGEATKVGAWYEKTRVHQQISGQIERIDNAMYKQFKRMKLDQALERQLIDDIHGAGLSDEFARIGNNVAKALKSKAIFRGLVSHAMRNGDQHAIESVAHAARQTRQVVQPHYDKALRLGLIGQDSINSIQATADSYLPKSYRKQKILIHKNEFETTMMTDGMRRGRSPEASIEMAQKFFDDLTGIDESLLSTSHIELSTNPMRARTALIRDNDINRFLNNDYVELWSNWGERVAGENVLAERGLHNHATPQIGQVADAYDKLISNAHADGAEQKVIEDLIKERATVIDDLNHFIKSIIGQKDPVQAWQKTPATAFSNLRKITASIKMAGVLVTSLVDLAAHTYHYGMPTQTKLMTNFVTSPEFRAALRDHADIIGVGFEKQLNSRMQSIADYSIDSMYSQKHVITKASDNLVSFLPMFSGIAHWNDFGKSLASIGHAVKATKMMMKQDLSQFEHAYLAQDGLGLENGIDWRARVLDQIRSHGTETDGVMMPNTNTWSDTEAAQRFEQFLFKKTHSTIITPTPGTLPVAVQNDPFMKTMAQFASFTMSAHEQLTIAGAQKSTADMAVGILSFLTVGAMVAQAKSFMRDGTFIDDPKEIMFNAIDNGGVLALPLEINNRLGKLGVPTVQSAFGVGQAKRMATQTPFSVVFGPSAGVIEDATKLTGDLSDGHLSEKGVRAASRLTPYVTTHFLTKYPMRMLTDEMMQAVGSDD